MWYNIAFNQIEVMFVAYIFLIISISASAARSMLSKRLSRFTSELGLFGLVNCMISLAAFALMVVYSGINGAAISAKTAVMSVFYAVFTTSSQLFYMKAMANGRVSSVTFFYSCGFLIPTLAGFVIWKEKITLVGALGILLLVPALKLCADRSEQVDSGRKWVIFALLATFSSGMVGLIQKLHQSSEVKAELGGFLLLAMGVSFLLSALIALIGKDRKQSLAALSCQIGSPGILRAALCGLCLGAANIINLTLTGIIPAIIFFPVFNGGVVLSSTLLARIICREKVSKRQSLGLILGLCGIVLIALK